MQKVIMCQKPDYSEVKVDIDEIQIKNGKFYVNGEELSMTVGAIDLVEIFYTGVKMAINGKITEHTADKYLKKISY